MKNLLKSRWIHRQDARGFGNSKFWGGRIAGMKRYDPPRHPFELDDCNVQYTAPVKLLKQQAEQINILILQNKRIEERLLAVETPKATSE
ncbi:Hypothetical protein PHPALM_11530 [Phytophthora palmivora]|uniref:Uncharacterized protein n=1 Tax=Phytophthora palmivora TaxID=4796 RepID=A0A2P4Y211_9STRA|nr:Hypothetical protein PHPALM_11530 [Phytophthora palmivora]